MKNNLTKNHISNSFKELLKTKEFIDITVNDICLLSELNRGSFYYHFSDKFQLVHWIFHEEFIKLSLNDMENYERNKFLKDLVEYLDSKREYYAKVLPFKGQNSFHEYLKEILKPLVRRDIMTELEEGKKLDFSVNYFTDMLCSLVDNWITSKEYMSSNEFIEFSNYVIVDLARKIEY